MVRRMGRACGEIFQRSLSRTVSCLASSSSSSWYFIFLLRASIPIANCYPPAGIQMWACVGVSNVVGQHGATTIRTQVLVDKKQAKALELIDN